MRNQQPTRRDHPDTAAPRARTPGRPALSRFICRAAGPSVALLCGLLCLAPLKTAAQGRAAAPSTGLTSIDLLSARTEERATRTDPDGSAQFPAPASTGGILVQTVDGRTVLENEADRLFNPASSIKLATALVAIRTLGPQYRFATTLWTDGALDRATGTLRGNLYVSGSDPAFYYEHAVLLARELNHLGISTVTGNLVVAPQFTMNFSPSARRSGDQLFNSLNASLRPAAASSAWSYYLGVSGNTASPQVVPSVAIAGQVAIGAAPAGARQLLVHRSSRLVDILKALLCYSNNFMAERIGDQLGGPGAVRRFLIEQVKLNPAEIYVETTSGLGQGRITPRAMMQIYRALASELARHGLEPSDILPVAGVDPGTLSHRYTTDPARASVIAKTGTLPRTDGGVCALVGQMRARNGETLYFVIFNHRGSVYRFRQQQDALVTSLQNMRGGPAPFAYRTTTLAMRLADTELNASGAETGEPAAN